MKRLGLIALLAFPGCTLPGAGNVPTEPRVAVETPASVLVEYPREDQSQAAASLAQARCATYGRDAAQRTMGFVRPLGYFRALYECRAR